MKYLLLSVFVVIVSGACGMFMDVYLNVEARTIYWGIGSLTGIIAGVLVGIGARSE
jgi:hypothetical protein